MSLLVILCDSLFGLHGKIETGRDRVMYVALIGVGVLISHFGHAFTLGCCSMNISPLGLAVWAEEHWRMGGPVMLIMGFCA